MKKTIVIGMLVGLLLGVTACGSTSEEVVETEKQLVKEEVVKEPLEEKTEKPTVEPTEVPTVEPTEEAVKEEKAETEFTADMGMEKVANLFNARNDLFANSYYDLNFLLFTESFGREAIDDFGITTKDGLELDTYGDWDVRGNGISAITTLNYFYDYVNNNCGYYDLGEYVTSHTENEIRSYLNIKLTNKDTNEIIMFEAIGALEYLLDNVDRLTCGELVSGENCTANPVSGIEVEYELPLLIDGESCGAKAVFDADGNMLNIITNIDEGWNEAYYLNCWDDIEAMEQ